MFDAPLRIPMGNTQAIRKNTQAKTPLHFITDYAFCKISLRQQPATIRRNTQKYPIKDPKQKHTGGFEQRIR